MDEPILKAFQDCQLVVNRETQTFLIEVRDGSAAFALSFTYGTIERTAAALKCKQAIIFWPGCVYPLVIPVSFSTPFKKPNYHQDKNMANAFVRASTLNLNTSEIDLMEEIIHNPFPAGIVRNSDRVLIIANKSYFDMNGKDPSEMLGKPVDPLCTQPVLETFFTDLYRSNSVSDYVFRGGYYALKNGLWLRDEYDFVGDAKKIEFLGADCYAFNNREAHLVRAGESWLD